MRRRPSAGEVVEIGAERGYGCELLSPSVLAGDLECLGVERRGQRHQGWFHAGDRYVLVEPNAQWRSLLRFVDDDRVRAHPARTDHDDLGQPGADAVESVDLRG